MQPREKKELPRGIKTDVVSETARIDYSRIRTEQRSRNILIKTDFAGGQGRGGLRSGAIVSCIISVMVE